MIQDLEKDYYQRRLGVSGPLPDLKKAFLQRETGVVASIPELEKTWLQRITGQTGPIDQLWKVAGGMLKGSSIENTNEAKNLLFGNSYLLDDNFDTARSTGAVNGTNAEPTGGARTVVDTNGKLSISGGDLTFATGGAANGDPGLWYASLSRVAGRALLTSIKYDSQIGFAVGFDTDQTGALTQNNFSGSGPSLRSRGESTNVNVRTISNGNTYRLAVILRASGAFYFFKDASSSIYELIYVDNNRASGTLYPSLATSNTTNNWRAGYIRIPTNLWLPTPIASDGFGSTYGLTDGLGHAETSGIGSGGANQAWVPTTSITPTAPTPVLGSELFVNGNFTTDTDWTKGAWTIGSGVANHASGAGTSSITEVVATVGMWYQLAWTSSNLSGTGGVSAQFGLSSNVNTARTTAATFIDTGRATSTTLGFRANNNQAVDLDNVSAKQLTLSSLLSATTTYSQTNYVARCTPTLTSGTQAGMAIQVDSETNPQNGVFVYHDGTSVKLDKLVSGTWTNLISSAATYSAGANLVIKKNGTTYSVFYNGAQVGSGTTIADASIDSGTKHNLFSTYASNSFGLFNITDYTTWMITSGKAVNLPNLGSELVVNGSMETGSPPSSWTAANSAILASVADERTGGTGMSAISVTNGAAAAGSAQQILSHAAGQWLLYLLWARGVTTGASVQILSNGGAGLLTRVVSVGTTWTQMVQGWRTQGANERIRLILPTSTIGLEARYDDVSIKSLTTAELFSDLQASTPDVLISADISGYNTGTQQGLALNVDSTSNPQNFIIAYMDGTNLKVDKCVAGTYTNLASKAFTYSSGAKLTVQTRTESGSLKVRLYYNEALIGSELTVSDAGIISNTLHGKFSTYGSTTENLFDNFTLYATGTEGQYSVLNSF